jgi:hypothetical protein
MTRKGSGMLNWGIFSLKLFLSLLTIFGFVGIIYQGYILFTQQISPIIGTIIFLVGIGLWIWIVTILRISKYRYSQPRLWMVLVSLLIITLTCAFAGIEPLSTYKDETIQKTFSFTEMVTDKMPSITNSISDEPILLPIATTTHIWADWEIVFGYHRDYLYVQLKPTNSAVADKEYTVDLYEKGKFRESRTVSWNQPELNVLKESVVAFSSNRTEYDAYKFKDISHIFNVKVHE